MQVTSNRSFKDFHSEVGNAPFTAEFTAVLERRMNDPKVKSIERVFCWIKYWSWRLNSRFCVRHFGGRHLIQADCVADLRLTKGTVSKAFSKLRTGRYLIPNTYSLGLQPIQDQERGN